MATHAANRLLTMTQNLAYVIAIEYLSAAQGIDFHKPMNTSKKLQKIMQNIRAISDSLNNDRSLAPDIECLSSLIISGELCPPEHEIFSK